MIKNQKIRFEEPADTSKKGCGASWCEALPIGNGAMGAMIYGGTDREILQLNEDTLWYGGGDRNRVNPEAVHYYRKIRELVEEGRIKEAQRLGKLCMTALPETQRFYTTAGNLFIDFENEKDTVCDYERILNLSEAVADIHYKIADTCYNRQVFASAKSHVIVMKLSSSKQNALNFTAALNRDRLCDRNEKVSENSIAMTGQEGGSNGVSYCVMAGISECDGIAYILGNHIVVENATQAVIMITIRTSFYGEDEAEWCRNVLHQAQEAGYERLLKEHTEEYQNYYNRSLMEMGTEEAEKLSTPARLEQLRAGTKDTGLIALYYNFGRYLLISCSREGSQPANLQGVWNREYFPAWDSKYTVNINTQMNYWPAEKCNLSEMTQPLFELLKRMQIRGRQVARDMYGCSGFVCHHNTDIWGDCAPQDIYMPATVWPMGAAWLCTHIWEHYLYTDNKEFLKEYYPVMREAAEFFTEYMFYDKNHRLITGPSVSPENTYIHPCGESGTLCNGPSMDSEIIRDLFHDCIQAAQILDTDSEFAAKLQNMLKDIPPVSIGKYGQIMEWREDYEEKEPGHRHISHLYGLFPSHQISVEHTPQLAKAAKITLERRLSNGGGYTGWSRAWIINMWARLYEGDRASENMWKLLEKSTAPNMFDMHPPFQIDGNFGGTRAVAEMIMQSNSDGRVTEIILLPALPSDWSEGKITGLRAHRCVTMDISWREGQLQRADIHFEIEGEYRIIRKDNDREIILRAGRGETYTIE